MRYFLLAVLLCGCVHKYDSHVPPPNAGKHDFSTCKLFDRFATTDVAVVIVKGCFSTNTTLVTVVFSSEFYDVAAEEAANITIRLLKYRPILTPIFKTFLLSADKKHSRPMIIFAVTGKL